MDPKEHELAEAAANLTVGDFHYLQEHGMIPRGAGRDGGPRNARAAVARAARTPRKGGRRRQVKHEWPEIGTILEANYHGVHYEAEVIASARNKSGKAVKVITGPAAGQILRSPSGAMLKATEAQRQAQDLGKKGVANGWAFWKMKPEPSQ